ncbi:hypothetical protein LIER_18207 [Lithospermum erythrorhizon]|uniref:Uncharacterized protein n=1 Tax=Lithospermum erythrorhizon TaxID=34254 RepID=A0AAV3QHJ7_LITER
MSETLGKVNFQSMTKLTVDSILIASLCDRDSGRTKEQPSLAPEDQRRTYAAAVGERKTSRVNRWRSSAFAYVIERFTKARWSDFGFEKVFKLASSMFLFQLAEDFGRDRMIEEGPWSSIPYGS